VLEFREKKEKMGRSARGERGLFLGARKISVTTVEKKKREGGET